MALVYAIRHPEAVATLILRGVFLGGSDDLRFMYQGNAETFADTPYALTNPGSYVSYPDEWKRFVEVIGVDQRTDMMAAYKAIFDMTTTDEADRVRQLEAALAWSVWEGTISNMIPEAEIAGKFGEAGRTDQAKQNIRSPLPMGSRPHMAQLSCACVGRG